MLTDIASGFYAFWLSLPDGLRWLLVGWSVIYLLTRAVGSRTGLWLLVEARRFYLRHRRWWTTDPKDTSRVLLGDLRADSERADMTAQEGAQILGYQSARVRLVDLPADFAGAPGMQWWRCGHCGRGRVFEGTFEQEAREATDHEARCAHRRAAFAVAAEPVSLVEPDVPVCAECGAPKDPVDDLVRGLFEPEGAEPGLTGWKPGMPPWGTPPWQGQENDAAARLFRQRMSDALRHHAPDEK